MSLDNECLYLVRLVQLVKPFGLPLSSNLSPMAAWRLVIAVRSDICTSHVINRRTWKRLIWGMGNGEVEYRRPVAVDLGQTGRFGLSIRDSTKKVGEIHSSQFPLPLHILSAFGVRTQDSGVPLPLYTSTQFTHHELPPSISHVECEHERASLNSTSLVPSIQRPLSDADSARLCALPAPRIHMTSVVDRDLAVAGADRARAQSMAEAEASMTATSTEEINNTIFRPGSVKINVKGAFIVDPDTSTPAPGSTNNSQGNGRGSPTHHETSDIRLPNHTAVVSHIAVDVRTLRLSVIVRRLDVFIFQRNCANVKPAFPPLLDWRIAHQAGVLLP